MSRVGLWRGVDNAVHKLCFMVNAYAILHLSMKRVKAALVGARRQDVRSNHLRKVVAQDGYTIVEVMIFLIVSGAMLIMATAILSGQQRKTEFSQAVRDMDSAMQDVANDVTTGFAGYNFDTGSTCSFNAAGKIIMKVGGPDASPLNRCVYIGKVVQFTPNGYRVFPVVGHQATSVGGATADVVSLTEAVPHALAPASAPDDTIPDMSFPVDLRYADVEAVTYNDGVDKTTYAVGFFTDFQGSAVNAVQSTGSGVQVIAFNPGAIQQDTSVTGVADAIQDLTNYEAINPSGGVTICVRSQGSDQIGYINIGTGAASGAGAGRLGVTSKIQTGGSCT
ncbi:hypothetical protein CR970_02110 [Candidatus Saccharibacteria bacterium]|nr:MAG: hypothetical protein CR970_02110 [Candidatus Saccharibacteria bacterium]